MNLSENRHDTSARFVSTSVEETGRLGRILAREMSSLNLEQTPVTVCLEGTLGAGKTTLVTAICQGFGIDSSWISSPTFSLQNIYPVESSGRKFNIFHYDFYRLVSEDELFETGFEEMVAVPGLHLIEWSNKFREALPAHRFVLSIESTPDSHRNITLSGCLADHTKLIDSVKRSFTRSQ